MQAADIQEIKRAREFVERARLMIQGGGVALSETTMNFIVFKVEFTPTSYGEFAMRSVEEVLQFCATGKMTGPVGEFITGPRPRDYSGN